MLGSGSCTTCRRWLHRWSKAGCRWWWWVASTLLCPGARDSKEVFLEITDMSLWKRKHRSFNCTHLLFPPIDDALRLRVSGDSIWGLEMIASPWTGGVWLPSSSPPTPERPIKSSKNIFVSAYFDYHNGWNIQQSVWCRLGLGCVAGTTSGRGGLIW